MTARTTRKKPPRKKTAAKSQSKRGQPKPLKSKPGNGAARGLAGQIHAVKLEIAALRHPNTAQNRLAAANLELAAVAEETEAAANDIFACVEQITRACARGLASAKTPAAKEMMREIGTHATHIIEALSFQDITGQRVEKVRRTLAFAEDRVTSMIDIWGQAGFENLPPPEAAPEDDDSRLLNGPQLDAGDGIDQPDIDAMFG